MLMGKNVGLRSLRTEDIWLLYRWYNDKRVTGELGGKNAYFSTPLEELRWQVERSLSSGNERHMLIVLLDDEKAIGTASLRHIDERNASAEYQLVIGEPAMWGKGYGKEATRMMVDHGFDILNLHRIFLRVAEYNDRAIACFADCGFKKDGLLRDDHYHLGAYMSSYLMSALRSDRAVNP